MGHEGIHGLDLRNLAGEVDLDHNLAPLVGKGEPDASLVLAGHGRPLPHQFGRAAPGGIGMSAGPGAGKGGDNPFAPPSANLVPDRDRHRLPGTYLALFCLLYAVQGVVFAYFANFNQEYMRTAGVSKEMVGLVGFLALLPFAFKFLAAPVSDRFSLLGLGHRKPYIVLGLIGQIDKTGDASGVEDLRACAVSVDGEQGAR